MLGADGKFYGTTAYGGTGGAIFRISSNGVFEDTALVHGRR